MTVDELLLHLTRLIFLLLNVITFVNYLRYRTQIHRTIFLAFLSLTVGIWIQVFRSITGLELEWLSKFSQLALVTQPFLMLHLVQYFQTVPVYLYRGSIIGMVGSWIGLIASGAPLSPIVTVVIIAYFVVADGYAALAFVHGAFSTIGVVRQRLRWAALGSAILAFVLLLAGVNTVMPSARLVTLPMIRLLAICCVSAYYLGFAPPRWLREAWQHGELRNYLQQIHSVSHRTSSELIENLFTGVKRVVGTNIAAIKFISWEEESGRLVVQASSTLEVADVPVAEVFQNSWRDAEAQTIYRSNAMNPELERLFRTFKAEMILTVPMATYEFPLGLMIIILQQNSLFVEDELRLLTVFAQQTAVLLQNYAMLEESKHYAEDLEEKVRLRTVELERLNEELKLLAYVASHDLQEPLRTISSYMQLIEQRYLSDADESAHELFAFVLNGVAQMKELIRDVLVYSRIETQSTNFTTFNCQDILDEIYVVLGVAIKEADATITNDKMPDITADRRLIIQLFQNLISNAIKYRNSRKPEIHIGVVPKEKEWIFSVRDNGIGIESQYLERIFVIFQRLHHRDQYDGTGIGLAVCKKAVELHQGRIWVDSQIDVGTCFYFSLPR